MSKPEHDSAKYWEAEAKRYCQNAEYWRTENLRVRGLLQRAQEYLRSAIKQAWLSNERQIKDFLKEAESAGDYCQCLLSPSDIDLRKKMHGSDPGGIYCPRCKWRIEPPLPLAQACIHDYIFETVICVKCGHNYADEAGSLLKEFAAKVGTWLSFRHGESYEGQDLELDELFELVEKYAPTETGETK